MLTSDQLYQLISIIGATTVLLLAGFGIVWSIVWDAIALVRCRCMIAARWVHRWTKRADAAALADMDTFAG